MQLRDCCLESAADLVFDILNGESLPYAYLLLHEDKVIHIGLVHRANVDRLDVEVLVVDGARRRLRGAS